MSTTLVPPSYYVVKPQGQSARVYETVAQAAMELSLLGGSEARVGAITGSRLRKLNPVEQRELERLIDASIRARTRLRQDRWRRSVGAAGQ